VKPETAKEHMLGCLRSKYIKDFDAKLTRVYVGDGVEGYEAINRLSEKRELLADHLLANLTQLYANREVALLVMHGIMITTERQRHDDPVMELAARALGGQVDDPTWWCLAEFRRILESRSDSNADFEHVLQVLYPDMKPMERHGLLDEFDDIYGGDSLPDAALQYLASKLVSKSEHRFTRWMDHLIAEDSSGRRAMGRADLFKIAHKALEGVPREAVQQAYSLVAVAWGAQEIPVEVLAMALNALELSTVKRAL